MAGRAKPVTRLSAFWDTSALVPLCLRQRFTPKAVAFYNAYEMVVWWGTPVEMASAFARLARLQQITPDDAVKARKLAQTLADSWSVIQPSSALRTKAVKLLDHNDLHAADALQLAAALAWCEDAPEGRIFLTADDRLREAALMAGFDAGGM